MPGHVSFAKGRLCRCPNFPAYSLLLDQGYANILCKLLQRLEHTAKTRASTSRSSAVIGPQQHARVPVPTFQQQAHFAYPTSGSNNNHVLFLSSFGGIPASARLVVPGPYRRRSPGSPTLVVQSYSGCREGKRKRWKPNIQRLEMEHSSNPNLNSRTSSAFATVGQ